MIKKRTLRRKEDHGQEIEKEEIEVVIGKEIENVVDPVRVSVDDAFVVVVEVTPEESTIIEIVIVTAVKNVPDLKKKVAARKM